MKSKSLENTNSCTYHVLWFYVYENLWDVYDCGGGDTCFNTILAELEHLPCILPPPTNGYSFNKDYFAGIKWPPQSKDLWQHLGMFPGCMKSTRIKVIQEPACNNDQLRKKKHTPPFINCGNRTGSADDTGSGCIFKHSDNMALTKEFGAEPGWKVGCFNPNEI